MNSVLNYSALSTSINKRVLFTALDLEIATAECIVLSGDNGAGKTTLLRILAGLQAPDAGTCRYNGQAHSWRNARGWLLRHVVYLHQKPYLFDASVTDNVAYGLRQHGYRNQAARAHARDALQRAGLEHLQARNARQLSGGESQRVALLRAWVLAPRLLLLDEPVANMDEQARHRTLFLIRQLQQDGVSLVITAHEPRLFSALANRHLCLREGQLVDALLLSPVTDNPAHITPPQQDDPHAGQQRH